MNDPRICKNCRFFTDEYEGAGTCVRYPPVPAELVTRDYAGVSVFWPRLNALHWCGEYESIPKTGRTPQAPE
jgi:hypothetical protein